MQNLADAKPSSCGIAPFLAFPDQSQRLLLSDPLILLPNDEHFNSPCVFIVLR